MAASALIKNWSRWIGIFMMLSFGSALLTGLEWAVRDRNPVLAFIGFWIAQIIFLVIPGLIVGVVVALATKRDVLGLRIMVGINTLATVAYLYGMLREGGLLP